MQATLWQLITAPENVTDAPVFVEGDPELPAVERVNIYANMYFFRILDCLKEDFPSLVKILGDREFHNLIVQYLQVYPPTHFSLRYVGQHLSEFLKGRGELADLAQFEWAQIEAFDAADAQVLTHEDLQKIPADDWPEMKLQLHPSCQLLHVHYNVHEICPNIQTQETYLRIWRQNLNVYHAAISADEFAALKAIQSGACFADVCAQVDDAHQVMTWLSGWISQGLLVQ